MNDWKWGCADLPKNNSVSFKNVNMDSGISYKILKEFTRFCWDFLSGTGVIWSTKTGSFTRKFFVYHCFPKKEYASYPFVILILLLIIFSEVAQWFSRDYQTKLINSYWTTIIPSFFNERFYRFQEVEFQAQHCIFFNKFSNININNKIIFINLSHLSLFFHPFSCISIHFLPKTTIFHK